MDILLVSEGQVPEKSPAGELQFLASVRRLDLTSSEVCGRAAFDVVVVELGGITPDGIRKLRSLWADISIVPVVCVASKSNRQETVQASALGFSVIFERSRPAAELFRSLGKLTNPDPAKGQDTGVPEEVGLAFQRGAVVLEDLCVAAAVGETFKVKELASSSGSIMTALGAHGLESWLAAVQNHHSATYRHSLMVSGIAGAFAAQLNWSAKVCQMLVAGGLVHDIGKVRIPLHILDKPGKLSDAEMDVIKKHPIYSMEILRDRKEVPEVIKLLAYQHHELLDGSGYPQGLKGDELDPPTRVMTISDIYSALIEDRAYRAGMPKRAAVAILLDMGAKLDQKLVKEFSKLVLSGPEFGPNSTTRRKRAAAVESQAGGSSKKMAIS